MLPEILLLGNTYSNDANEIVEINVNANNNYIAFRDEEKSSNSFSNK